MSIGFSLALTSAFVAGLAECLRQINRPSGQRVISVRARELQTWVDSTNSTAGAIEASITRAREHAALGASDNKATGDAK